MEFLSPHPCPTIKTLSVPFEHFSLPETNDAASHMILFQCLILVLLKPNFCKVCHQSVAREERHCGDCGRLGVRKCS